MIGKSGIVMTALLLLNTSALMGIIMVGKVYAQTTVSVVPAINVFEVGEEFTVSIDVGYVRGINTWQFSLRYDSSILCTDIHMIEEGDFLSQGGATFACPFTGINYVGMICSVDDIHGWVDGSGTLATIRFRVIDNGRVDLDLYDTVFYGPTPQGPLPEQPIPVDGVFYTTYPRASFYYLPSPTACPDYRVNPVLVRNPVVNEVITFNASAYTSGRFCRGSFDTDGTITTYGWDFGDGTTAIGLYAVVYHSYAEAKSYLVKLTVTDNEGRTSSHIEYVLVEKLDVAVTNIEAYPTIVSPGGDVSIKVTINNLGSINQYANVTLYQRHNTVDTLIWYNKTERKPAFSTALEKGLVNRVPPLHFPPGKSIVVNYTWTTTGLAPGEYSIWANISLTDRSGKKFLKDIYQKELDCNLTNNVLLWDGKVKIKFIAAVNVDPGTLNLKSKGQWITAYVQLPEGYNAADIDVATILLNGTILPVLNPNYGFVTNSSEYLVDHNNDGILERMVKFNRAAVEFYIYYTQGIRYGNVALTITGELLDGTPFEGTAIIFVNYLEMQTMMELSTF